MHSLLPISTRWAASYKRNSEISVKQTAFKSEEGRDFCSFKNGTQNKFLQATLSSYCNILAIIDLRHITNRCDFCWHLLKMQCFICRNVSKQLKCKCQRAFRQQATRLIPQILHLPMQTTPLYIW